MATNNLIREAAADTPDPERALKNLERLLQQSPDFIEAHSTCLSKIALLFSYSQFLADYSAGNPSSLSSALNDHSIITDKQEIISDARKEYAEFRDEERPALYREKAMRLLRKIKKDRILRITLKDVSGAANMNECMTELSTLSEALLELALDMSFTLMRRKFGLLRDNDFSLIALGKLGAGELNYSSDIDIITVYRSDEGISTGILNPFGIRYNKISSHEYFCTFTETLTNLLQSPTEDGIVYRVDLRLRPNGRKGAPALSLDSYRSYYEAWGKTWERVALIRARPVAGDKPLGERFMHAIEPFVWKRSMDYSDIEEVRELKKRIDAIFDINDIKRGYGGIRETEFFVHTFQLLYGGERKNLRKGFLTNAIGELLREGFLSGDEAGTLSDSYMFFRRIEHILQMKDDMQIYNLPVRPEELEILSRKAHFEDAAAFSAALRLKRLKVRDMYNSLLGTPDTAGDIMLSLKDELPESAFLDYLSFRGFKNPESALKNIGSLNEHISVGKTMRERTLLLKAIPLFLEQIVKSVNKDRALKMLVSFIGKIGNHGSYIDLLLQRKDTRDRIADTFSTSTYLTRLLLSLENIEGVFEYPDIRMDYKSLQDRIINTLAYVSDPKDAVREFKIIEELKSGLLFLGGFLDVYRFLQTLSMLADVIMRSLVKFLNAGSKVAVIGLGGIGARELNINSDLDLIFISAHGKNDDPEKVSMRDKAVAEDFIKFLSEYTSKGVAYKVDMRLRPDGSKGTLMHDIKGYKNYYLRSAQPWELQVLLRSRPIAGNKVPLRAFLGLKKQILMQRGKEIGASYIKAMRKRIVQGISREASGYDIKNGPGGLKEIEFLVQYLQLKHIPGFPDLITHSTVTAIKRLARCDILDKHTEVTLLDAHRLLKTVETLLRLNEEDVLDINSGTSDIIMRFLDMKSKDKFIKQIEDTRNRMLRIATRLYEHK